MKPKNLDIKRTLGKVCQETGLTGQKHYLPETTPPYTL